MPFGHDAYVGLEVNVTWGDSWRRPKGGLGRVVDRVQAAAPATRTDWVQGDPSVDLYIYVSGSVWQHKRQGIRLGTLSSRGRNSLRVMIYVPDELADEVESAVYFRTTLNEVADRVQVRLSRTRPGWPIDSLAAEIRLLHPEER